MVALQHEIQPKYKMIMLWTTVVSWVTAAFVKKWSDKTRYWRWRGVLCPLKFKRAFEKVIFGERWHTQSSTWSNLWRASTQTGGKCQFSQNWKINVSDQEIALRLPLSFFFILFISNFIIHYFIFQIIHFPVKLFHLPTILFILQVVRFLRTMNQDPLEYSSQNRRRAIQEDWAKWNHSNIARLQLRSYFLKIWKYVGE